MKIHPNFDSAIRSVGSLLELQANEIPAGRWQSKDMSKDPAARMKEVLNVSFQVVLQWNENPKVWVDDIKPNMPWAEDHFLERVCGKPLNPGVQWANWPWALSADKFRTEGGGKFSHTYMERYWPKQANKSTAYEQITDHVGIRYRYGDLNDVVDHLLGDRLTRQAYLPIWFPEDTGTVHGERVPCTLGYHFIQRGNYLHSTYYIRSCDFFRHFRDDLYLSVRLQLWLLQQLREKELAGSGPDTELFWDGVKMGTFTFHCVSMHMFVNDWNKLFGKRP
jgi:hypothetical protein